MSTSTTKRVENMKLTKRNVEQVLATIPTVSCTDYKKVDGVWVEIPVLVKPTAFMQDGAIILSGEAGDGLCDYYGESSDGDSFIHPVLEDWAESVGAYWEWNNPGCAILCQE